MGNEWLFKLRILGLTEHVAITVNVRYLYRISVVKSQRKRVLRGSRSALDNNIKMYPNTVSRYIPKSYWSRNRCQCQVFIYIWLVSLKLPKLPKLRAPKKGGEEFLTSWATTWLLWRCLLQIGEVSVAGTWKCEPTRWRVKRKTVSLLPATIIRANQSRNTLIITGNIEWSMQIS